MPSVIYSEVADTVAVADAEEFILGDDNMDN
jgi:hypothetical protein